MLKITNKKKKYDKFKYSSSFQKKVCKVLYAYLKKNVIEYCLVIKPNGKLGYYKTNYRSYYFEVNLSNSSKS